MYASAQKNCWEGKGRGDVYLECGSQRNLETETETYSTGPDRPFVEWRIHLGSTDAELWFRGGAKLGGVAVDLSSR